MCLANDQGKIPGFWSMGGLQTLASVTTKVENVTKAWFTPWLSGRSDI